MKNEKGEQKSNQQPQSEYQRVRALMKEIGSPDGFDPLPPSQHRWMMDPDVPGLQRFWGWMIAHTVHWGHRSAFAIDKSGIELHIEHAAKDLEMDLANAYHYWRLGLRRGLWRNGQPSEGVRRLYLTGKVPKFRRTEGDEKSVHTIFSAAILKQINGLSAEQKKALRDSLEAEIKLEKDVQAALVAANRAVFIQRQDSIYSQYGVNPSRQEHVKPGENPADAEARRSRIEPIRAPIELYVETIRNFVQSAPKTPCTDSPSLLTSESNCQSNGSRVARSVDSWPASTPPVDGKKSHKQLPAAVNACPLSELEKQAEMAIYTEIRAMQQAFKHMDFARELISPKRKSDQLFAYRVLSAVGPENVEQFLARVAQQLKNLDKNAFGKLPGQAPAPRSLGLILQWATEYSEHLDEAAKLEAAERTRWTEREIRACQEILEDPTETAEAKHGARKILEGHSLKKEQTA